MTKTAIFAAGCFWGIEEKFLSTDGVIETEVGYIGGKTSNPSYQDVCEGNTNHAEAVRVHYNEEKITYDNLLDIFFEIPGIVANCIILQFNFSMIIYK